jgi:hypothetical protein
MLTSGSPFLHTDLRKSVLIKSIHSYASIIPEVSSTLTDLKIISYFYSFAPPSIVISFAIPATSFLIICLVSFSYPATCSL